MHENFAEIKIFQVKPDKLTEFEKLIPEISSEQKKQTGCAGIKYLKRFYTFDGGNPYEGNPPRELTKIVKCVKYYSYWEFDTKENYGKATGWFFANYHKAIEKLLISPFDINCGEIAR